MPRPPAPAADRLAPRPASLPANRGWPRLHRARIRRRRLGLALVLLLAYAVLQLLSDAGPARVAGPARPPAVRVRADQARGGSPVLNWPFPGQAALAFGDRRPVASAGERPVSVASLAKVMTAYLTLRRDPLRGAQDGFTITVTAAEAQDAARAAAQDESVVAVRSGERLTERQLLEALLVPSANNVARMLAVRLAGGEDSFVAEMNAAARALGMEHTIYTDPSGFDPSTVSTAADQLRVFTQAMRLPVFRQIVAMPSVTLPVAGTLTNFNPLVTDGYAGKTGSDAAAGGCLAFDTTATVDGHRQTATGVVLGQGGGGDTRAMLAAAGQAARELVAAAAGRPAVTGAGPGPAGHGAPAPLPVLGSPSAT